VTPIVTSGTVTRVADYTARDAAARVTARFGVTATGSGTTVSWQDGPAVTDVVTALEDVGWRYLGRARLATTEVICPEGTRIRLRRTMTAVAAAAALLREPQPPTSPRITLDTAAFPAAGHTLTDAEQIAITLILDEFVLDIPATLALISEVAQRIAEHGGAARLLDTAAAALTPPRAATPPGRAN
jgi:hypothetical protein